MCYLSSEYYIKEIFVSKDHIFSKTFFASNADVRICNFLQCMYWLFLLSLIRQKDIKYKLIVPSNSIETSSKASIRPAYVLCTRLTASHSNGSCIIHWLYRPAFTSICSKEQTITYCATSLPNSLEYKVFLQRSMKHFVWSLGDLGRTGLTSFFWVKGLTLTLLSWQILIISFGFRWARLTYYFMCILWLPEWFSGVLRLKI